MKKLILFLLLLFATFHAEAQELGDAVMRLKDQMASTSGELLGLETAYNTVINNNSTFLTVFISIISTLSVLFILFRTIQNIYENAELKKENKPPIFGPRELIAAILMAFLIPFYQSIFGFVEGLMVEISSAISMDSALSKEIWNQSFNTFLIQAARDVTAETIRGVGEQTVLGINVAAVTNSSATLLAPNKYVYGFCGIGALVGFFNYLVSFIAYIDRSILLLVLNCLAPLIFALSLVKGMESIVRKFFLIYITVFLVLPFLLIGFQILDMLYIELSTISGIYDLAQQETDLQNSLNDFGKKALDTGVAAADVMASITNYDIFLRLPLLILVVATKIKSMSLITNTLWRILT